MSYWTTAFAGQYVRVSAIWSFTMMKLARKTFNIYHRLDGDQRIFHTVTNCRIFPRSITLLPTILAAKAGRL